MVDIEDRFMMAQASFYGRKQRLLKVHMILREKRDIPWIFKQQSHHIRTDKK